MTQRGARVAQAQLWVLQCMLAFMLQGCGNAPTEATTIQTTIVTTTMTNTSTKTSTTTTTTTTIDLATPLNDLFQQENDGVLIRSVGDYEQPWLGGGDHTSWQIFNKYAWDTEQQALSVYGCGKYNAYVRPSAGIIAKNVVKSTLVSCIYPCDGGTKHRFNDGCGCPTWAEDCTQPNHEDWCGSTSFHSHGPGSICALHPDEISRALQAYKEIKEGKGMFTQCENQFVGPHTNAWTEVDIETKKWNAVANTSVLAFHIPDQCESISDCMAQFQKMYSTWVKLYGHIPVLRLNRTDRANPFSTFRTETAFTEQQGVAV